MKYDYISMLHVCQSRSLSLSTVESSFTKHKTFPHKVCLLRTV